MAVADSITKYCRGCDCQLPHSEFSPDARASDGLQPRCRKCTNIARKAARLAKPEQYKAARLAYYAEKGDRVRAINAKSRAKNHVRVKAHKRLAYQAIKDKPEFKAYLKERIALTRDAKREYDREYRAKRAEHLDAIHKAWRAKNPDKIRTIRFTYAARRRAQEAGGDSTAAIHKWAAAAAKVCHWCGKKCAKSYHIDHYVPLSKGGKHEISNLVIACPKCNIRKNAKDPYEFAASVGRLF